MCDYSINFQGCEHRSGLLAEALRLGGVIAKRERRAAAATTAEERAAQPDREAVGRGLSLKNKVPEVQAVNTETGEMFVIDPQKARLSRMRRRVKAWSDALKRYIHGRRYRMVMITLTYKPGQDWEAGHIRAFMKRVRRRLGAGLVGYAWVAEMQKRGAVHYHVLLVVKRGTSIPRPDKAGWWCYGSTRIETARTVYYILSYTGKEYQKVGYPKGLRIFAVWIAKDVITAVERLYFRLSALPAWLANRVAAVVLERRQFPKRRRGGGWLLGGEVYRSPWRVKIRYVLA